MTDERTTCSECGGDVALAATVPAGGGRRRCSDDDRCEERKDARASFAA